MSSTCAYNACTARQARTRAYAHAPAIMALAAALVLAAALALAFAPQRAYADDLSFVTGSASKTVRVTTAGAKEQAAYNRAFAACMDYRNTIDGGNIIVDVSDIGLTSSQAIHAAYLLHSNGELFWVNTFNDSSFKTDKFTIPCYYDADTIDTMRAKLNAQVASALKRITPQMDTVTKLHALHDWLIDRADYADKAKTAYDGLVNGKGDCFGFTLSMDVLLRRAGFTVDMAYNNAGSHSWNLVKVGSKWFNIDVTWDNGNTGKGAWKKKRCHYYFLQSDKSIRQGDDGRVRGNWWAHHTCTSTKYDKCRMPEYKNSFDLHCHDYKAYTTGFAYKGLKYKACGAKKVMLVGATSKRKSKTVTIPATVKFKKISYQVVGIGQGAFAGAKAKTLKVYTKKFSKGRVAGSLTGSKVTKIKLMDKAKKKKKAYRKYFAASNCGKKVKVK